MRFKVDTNKLIVCVSTTNNTDVQFVEYVGTYEVIIPPGHDCLVMSLIRKYYRDDVVCENEIEHKFEECEYFE